MRAIVVAFRCIAILAGLFLVGSSIADVAGLLPHSDEMPPLVTRLRSIMFPVGIGLVLLAPQRWFLRPSRFYVLLSAHGLLVALTGHSLMKTVPMVRAEQLDPAALPAALAALAVPVLSGAALWLARRTGTPPNNSSKPMPLRGMA